MTEDMRYDPDTASSNGFHHASNGSQQYSPRQKAQFPNGTNGHSSSNGSSSSHANGSTPSIARARTPSFFGHDREEVTRLLIQGLEDLGYHQAANRLSQESGYEVQSPEVASFRIAVLEGDWNEAEALLFGSKPPDGGGGVSISSSDHRGLKFVEGADLDRLRFRMRTQKYLELLESKDLGRALMVLRQELTPLNQERSEVQRLSRYALQIRQF